MQAGHSGPRALDCAKQVNIARTSFIRIEKALLLSGGTRPIGTYLYLNVHHQQPTSSVLK